MQHLKYLLLLLAFFSSFNLCGKDNPHFGNYKVEGNVMGGAIWVHTPRFKPNASKPIGGVELSIYKQTFGTKDWHSKYSFPEVGIKFIYINYNNKVLGESFSLAPFIQYHFLKYRKLKIYGSFAMGISAITKKYDRLNNPTNNVIGSTLNEATQVKLGFNYQLPDAGFFNLSMGLTHASNGRYSSPNLGINAMGITVGYNHFISHTPSNYRTVQPISYNKKIQFNFKLSYGQGQSGVDGGPKGSHYTAFLGLGKRWCYINRWNAGMWYEYNKGAKRGLNFYEELPKSFPESNLGAVLIGDEFIFGKLSIIGNVGYYLFKGSGKGFFEQAGAQYILYTFNKEKQKQLYTGIILKESNFDAEYFEWHVGFRF